MKNLFVVFFVVIVFATSCNGFEVPKTGTASQIAETALKEFEGLRLTKYQDIGGTWTIGYGSTKKSLVSKGTITKDEALQQLREDISSCEKAVNDLVVVSLTEHQKAALISFVYNLGRTNFAESTLLKELNQGHYNEVPTQLRRWVHSKGKVVKGLKNRREKEILLWNYKPEK